MIDKTQYLMNTYNPEKISFVKGDGVWLWDDEGNQYLDTSAGIAVMSLGHSHPEVIQALKHQADKIMHVSNGSIIQPQLELAYALAEATGMEKSFFCNSGAEAIETALKIARRFGYSKDYHHPKIITMKGAFHGRTMSALSAANNPMQQKLFDPMMPGTVQCDFDDFDQLENLLKTTAEVVAVLLEPVQGEGGVRPHSKGYLKAVRTLCDQYDVLMMLDEVQTGFGRTGALYAFQHEGILPDVVASAKGLGNGFPIGVCMAKGIAANIFNVGDHGSTYGGNHLACTVSLKALEIMQRPGFHEHTHEMAQYLMDGLAENLKEFDCVKDIRGKGLLIGIELDGPCGELKKEALRNGVVINITRKNIIRLTPPLILDKSHCDEIIKCVSGLVEVFSKNKVCVV